MTRLEELIETYEKLKSKMDNVLNEVNLCKQKSSFKKGSTASEILTLVINDLKNLLNEPKTIINNENTQEVFSLPECIYHYCPHHKVCKEKGCQCKE